MIYVFDTSSFIVMSHYFPDRFPTFWEHVNQYVATGRILSVREVRAELVNRNTKEHLEIWIKQNSDIFKIPNQDETLFIREIFLVSRFRDIVRKKQLLAGMPVADPFVIAAAKVYEGCVVSEETRKPNSAQIPNVCDHFNVPCTNLEGFMEQEGWSY